ncbi:MAG: hypothetical protein U9P49_04285 [Thermodesulfobacteriota bacterium]|nr:hypothetical protein [Thermodesulfobacteriota bacterium]
MKVVNQQFTHLKADEKEIAKRFVKYAKFSGTYVYDVHLDVEAPEPPDHWTTKDIRAYQTLRAKRIDLLVKKDSEIWIFEITPKVSKAAVGGVLTYRDLYKKQYKPKVPVHVGIIVEMDDKAYHETLEKLNIKLWVV